MKDFVFLFIVNKSGREKITPVALIHHNASDGNFYKYMPRTLKCVYAILRVPTLWQKKKYLPLHIYIYVYIYGCENMNLQRKDRRSLEIAKIKFLI